MDPLTPPLPRLAAVSYLNTIPLIEGFRSGPQADVADLSFLLPAACADAVHSGRADAGLVPVIEIARQGLAVLGDVGIACRGAVRSILLISKVPAASIRSLAADSSSRTSVMLTRVLLAHHFGASDVDVVTAAPDLPSMLRTADAALMIGDPALRLEPSQLPYFVHDLGQEWWNLTGLPMVFALWAGRRSWDLPFRASYEFGRSQLDTVLPREAARRELPLELARDYLTRSIHYEIGAEERRGLDEYWRLAAIMEQVSV